MRVVLIHGSPLVSRIIELVLSEADHEVISTTDLATLREATEHETHAVIIGTNLLNLDSFQVCKELRAAQYNGPILFVTRDSKLELKLKAFHHGADDYILEPFEPEELLARLEAMARRCSQLDQQPMGVVVKVEDAELSVADMTFRRNGEAPVTLTPTEMRLLERLMRNAGITISRDTLIERTWGYDYFGDSNRVDVYIARIRKKIEPNPANPQYLHTVRGVGYVFRPRKIETAAPTQLPFADDGITTYPEPPPLRRTAAN